MVEEEKGIMMTKILAPHYHRLSADQHHAEGLTWTQASLTPTCAVDDEYRNDC
jgi:hypothetical protein